MKLLIVFGAVSLALVGCSDGFKIDPANTKISGTTGYGGSTGFGGTTGGTTGGTSGGSSGSTSGGTTSGGTTSGGTTGSSCTAGSRGTLPDLSGLVSTFKSQNGNLLNADCSTGSRQFVTGLVTFLRGQGHNRVGHAGGYNEIDKLAYVWDNGSCEGSTNTTVVDVLGSSCTVSNPQFNEFAQNARFTMTPPSGGSPETGSTTGGSSGGTTGGDIDSPPDEEATVDAISNANPGMINDCTGIPIVNNFLLTVVRALQQKDPRWGFMKKTSPFRIPRDVLAYKSRDSEGEGTHHFFVIDFVSSGCNNWPSAPEYNDPMPNAGVWWHVTNEDTGYADNGTWSFDP